MIGHNRVSPLYGTDEMPQPLRQVRLGDLSFLYAGDGIRRICWQGEELLRAIAWPMRDENWGTYAPEPLSEQVESDYTRFSADLRFAVGGGRLVCAVTVEATADGDIRAQITMTPEGGAFATNRSGFTVLHPIRDLAGGALQVTHSDGRTEDTVFPRLISPDQPVMDIAGMRYDVGGARVDITFDGEVFEMEDQRNWSDASYKTYCVPLVYPFTYEIAESATQTIRLQCSGAGAGTEAAPVDGVQVGVGDAVAPQIGLVAQAGWIGGAEARVQAAAIGASHVLLRMGAGETPPDVAGLAPEIAVELVLEDDADPKTALTQAAKTLETAGITPSRVLALRAGYLGSHQPSGPWPDGPTPPEVCTEARAVFPNAEIGGGMMTNFTELNRCRPDPARCDFITHANTAIVHASDDMSVLETLETLPQVFASAQAMSGGKPYRLGLVSIGMRTNPYGADVVANPDQLRRTMARIDPRHRGLFGAAWAVGVLAATAGSAVQSLCLAAPVGPFGVVIAPQDYPQVGYDGTAAQVTPLYHILRAACAMAGAPRLQVTGLPRDMAAFGVARDGRATLLIANLSDGTGRVTLPATATLRMLDGDSFADATASADWLDTTSHRPGGEVEIAPYAIALADWEI